MTGIDFFFDPVCPWAWITSRWVVEVGRLRDLDVRWRFICLHMVNAERDYERDFAPGYEVVHVRGKEALRVAAAVRATEGDARVGDWYEAVGTLLHPGERRVRLVEDRDAVFGEALAAAGLPGSLLAAVDDVEHDAVLQAETEEALDRTGRDVGTPIITFEDRSFFGPVLSRAPTGDDALAVWDAVQVLARHEGFAELKRSLREPRRFD